LRIGYALSHVVNAHATRIHHASAKLLCSRLAWSALQTVEGINEPTQKRDAIDHPFNSVDSTPHNACDIARRPGGIDGDRPRDRILSHSTQRFARLRFDFFRLARRNPGSAIFGILQELGPVADDITRRTQLEVLPEPDRFSVGLVRGGFSLPTEASNLAVLTIYELRDAFVHASSPAKGPPFLTSCGMLESGRHRAQRRAILPAGQPNVKNKIGTLLGSMAL